MSPPYVSVVVPVYSHAHLLPACIHAMERQTYPPERYEVIVVDNGVAPSLARPDTRLASVSVIREVRPGSYAARNAGVSAARGDVFAFTDVDCLPTERWLELGVAAIAADAGRVVVGGGVRCTFRRSDRVTPVELYDSLVSYTQDRFVERRGFAITANLFVPRAVLEEVGPFDARLKSSGDVEFSRRVRRAGITVSYCEGATVEHAARTSLRELASQTRRVAGGVQELARADGAGVRVFLADFIRHAAPIRTMARGVVDRRLGGPLRRAQFLALCILVRWLKAAEQLRVLLGGAARRS